MNNPQSQNVNAPTQNHNVVVINLEFECHRYNQRQRPRQQIASNDNVIPRQPLISTYSLIPTYSTIHTLQQQPSSQAANLSSNPSVLYSTDQRSNAYLQQSGPRTTQTLPMRQQNHISVQRKPLPSFDNRLISSETQCPDEEYITTSAHKPSFETVLLPPNVKINTPLAASPSSWYVNQTNLKPTCEESSDASTFQKNLRIDSRLIDPTNVYFNQCDPNSDYDPSSEIVIGSRTTHVQAPPNQTPGTNWTLNTMQTTSKYPNITLPSISNPSCFIEINKRHDSDDNDERTRSAYNYKVGRRQTKSDSIVRIEEKKSVAFSAMPSIPQGLRFPSLLYRILMDAEIYGFTNAISFLPNGRAFAVTDKQDFMDKIMPNYFAHSSFKSFRRYD